MKKRCPPARGWPGAILLFHLIFLSAPPSSAATDPAFPAESRDEAAVTALPDTEGAAAENMYAEADEAPASSSRSDAESPRERGRVLQKRNPIASEYQVIGFLGVAPGAAADGEGSDYRAFFPAGGLPLGGGPSLRLETFAQYQRYRGRALPGGSLRAYTPLPGDRPAGIEINATLSEVERYIDHYEAAWANIASEGDSTEAWLLERPRFSRDRIRTRVRMLRLRGEYEPSPQNTLYAQLLAGDYNDLHFRNRLELNFRTATPEASQDGVPGRDITYIAAGTDVGTARRYFGETTNRRTTVRAVAGGTHTAPRWTLDYSGFASRWINRPLVHAWNFGDRDLQLTYRIEDPNFPDVRLSPVERVTASDESFLSNYRIQKTRTTDTDLAARFDIDADLNGAGDWRFYTGGLYREKERVNHHDRDVFGPRPGSPLSFADAAEADLPDPVVRGTYYLPPWIDSARAKDLRAEPGSAYLRNDAQSTVETFEQRYRSFESVAGVYGILGYRGQKFEAEAGGRLESTRTRTLGTVVVPEAFVGTGGGTIGEVDVNGERRVIEERPASNTYTNALASLSLAYRPTPAWTLRTAAYDALMRPQYFDIVEYRRVALPTRTISEGNPALAPTAIRAYLLAAERTGLPVGDIAVELYRIDVDDFFYTAQRFEFIDGVEFSRSRVENGDSGRVSGFQIQWQNDLPPLPGDARATLSTAYTYSQSSASVGTRPDESFALPERSRHLLRTNLRVRRNGLTATAEFSYQSSALDQLGESAGRDIYRGDVLSLDAALAYTAGDYTLSASVTNILNHPERAYAGEPARATRNQYSSQIIRLGIAAQF
ncbi:MAG: outer membrane beta-barrel protein [Opitutales bacterium]|nr:outer membrane beta-barrel protein [Opitutales bacterium]